MMKGLVGDRSGTAGVEFALLIPMLILLFLGTITLFDLYREYWRQVQATHIVSDLISRETVVSDAYLTKVFDVYSGLLNVEAAGKAMRISSVTFNGKDYISVWTVEKGDPDLIPKQKLSNAGLPAMSSTDTVIYVESFGTHKPFSSYLGFANMTFAEAAVARPRFVSAIIKE
ncbi:pilus assembly protein (plasmid) [Peteryoungia desertarenae]|uniref:Pilus assembly protein n=1 Tax=Peteryoungia desertarenae TaxID=1813451 RepID=A0ABX6QTF6_9HYPH|nr:TadE/TadG family type IV pilus assembly protein [Peteryoungia desertarenae]QLF71602.1 pilus assembly protein [Peteryoungia desertarenae]